MRIYIIFWAVSYTHLLTTGTICYRSSDEGQRWNEDKADTLMRSACWLSSDDAGTVSYTHLDVYKRQVVHRLLLPCLPLAKPAGDRALLPMCGMFLIDVYKRQVTVITYYIIISVGQA